MRRLIATAALAGLLAACGSSSPSSAPDPTTTTRPRTTTTTTTTRPPTTTTTTDPRAELRAQTLLWTTRALPAIQEVKGTYDAVQQAASSGDVAGLISACISGEQTIEAKRGEILPSPWPDVTASITTALDQSLVSMRACQSLEVDATVAAITIAGSAWSTATDQMTAHQSELGL